ncbi:MAG: 3'(2'),5'-bisphosphate nucleotidase CysQ [Gemmatimonadota bacterium]
MRYQFKGDTRSHPAEWSFAADAGSYQDDLRVAAEAALEGGRAAMPHYGDPALSTVAGGRGPVTAADRASHEAIVKSLRASRPGEPILSEEGDHIAEPTGRFWIVDPLDGTQEFILRIGEFCVMVGLAIDGRAMVGAVFRPDPGILYLGVTDVATWTVDLAAPAGRGPARLTVPSERDGLRFVRSRSHPDERLERLERLLNPSATVLCGSVGTKCALIAEGRADLYVHPVPYLNEWDTCAPEAILRGAGGRVTDCLGEELRYGKEGPRQLRGIFAASSEIWESVSSKVFEVGRSLAG